MDDLANQKDLVRLRVSPVLDEEYEFCEAISKLPKLESLSLWATYDLERDLFIDEPINLEAFYLPSALKKLELHDWIYCNGSTDLVFLISILEKLPLLESLEIDRFFEASPQCMALFFDSLVPKKFLFDLKLRIYLFSDREIEEETVAELLRQVKRLHLVNLRLEVGQGQLAAHEEVHQGIMMSEDAFIDMIQTMQFAQTIQFTGIRCPELSSGQKERILSIAASAPLLTEVSFRPFRVFPDPHFLFRASQLEDVMKHNSSLFQHLLVLGRPLTGLKAIKETRLPLELVQYILFGSHLDWPAEVKECRREIIRCLTDRRSLGHIHTGIAKFKPALLYQRCVVALKMVKLSD